MRSVSTLIIIAALAACGTGAEPHHGPSDTSEWHSVPRARLLAPSVVIGGDESRRDGVLHRVTSPRFSPTGQILVPNDRSEVRIYEVDGTLRGIIGRAGDGPGEFRDLWSVVAHDGHIVTFDPRHLRLSWFSADGVHLRSVRLSTHPVLPQGLHSAGPTAFFGLQFSAVDMSAAGTYPRTMSLHRFDGRGARLVADGFEAGPLQVALEAEGPVWNGIPFGPMVHLAGGAGRLYVVEGGRAGVHAFDQLGRPEWTRVVPMPRRPVTPALRNSWCDSYRCTGPGRPITPEFPDALPMIQRVAGASDGSEVWLQEYVAASDQAGEVEWWILTHEGSPLRRVLAPTSLRITDVRDRRVLGVFTDAFGVQTVRVYGLTMPPEAR